MDIFLSQNLNFDWSCYKKSASFTRHNICCQNLSLITCTYNCGVQIVGIIFASSSTLKNFTNLHQHKNNKLGKFFIPLKSTKHGSKCFYNPLLDQNLYGPQKKIGDVKGRIAFVSHEFWNVQIQNKIYSTLFIFSTPSSSRWEELVQIEW